MRDDSQPIKSVLFNQLETIGLIVEHTQASLSYLFHGTVNSKEFWRHAYETAWKTISTVVITTTSIGAVSSLQLTKHFATFGALSEIGGANAMAQVRELGPVITAIVVIGRIGSAWAAEIGSMKITEQVNALKVMRISPEWFSVAPRVLACMLAMPILNVVAIISSLVGGYIVAELIAGVGIVTFVDSVKRYIDVYDFFVTSFKSVCFGATVASIACSFGLQASGGAAGVGKYTTRAVVTSLICLFAFNYVLSSIFFSLLK
ncbi:MAG: ABC transporter permease [Candidatus Caenarcaniphilales bacterium]|nr:ABC transporter permease [Candidatus Caenarcaniphilales bacterium]